MPAVLEKTPDASLLMSLNIMRHLGATIDLQQMSISFKHICRDRVIRVPLFRNASGQLCMSLFGLSKMSTNPERLTVRKVVGDECYLFHTTVMGTDEGNSKVDSHDVTSSNYPENVQNSVAAAIKLSRKSFESSQDISIEPTSNHVRHLRHGGCSYQQERTSRSLVEAEHERTEHHDSSVAASGVSGPFGRSYEEHSVADDDSRNAHPRTDEFLHMQHMVEQAVLRCKQQEKINKEKHKQERMGFWAIPPRSWRTRVALRQQKAMEGRSRVQQAVTSQWGATQWWNRSRTKTRKRKRRRKTRQSRKWIFTASAYVDWQWQNLCVARRDPTTRGNCPRERGRQCDFFMTEEGPVRGDGITVILPNIANPERFPFRRPNHRWTVQMWRTCQRRMLSNVNTIGRDWEAMAIRWGRHARRVDFASWQTRRPARRRHTLWRSINLWRAPAKSEWNSYRWPCCLPTADINE